MTANLTTRLGQLTSTPAGGPYTGKNRIINGNVSVDQRNAGASQTFTAGAAVAYCVDRFYASCTGANITGQQVAGTAPYQYAYKFTGATSNTGTLFGQRIESLNIADLVSTNVVVQAQIASSTITTVTWTAYYANTANTFSSKTSIATGTITITSTPTIYTFSFNTGSSAANGVAIEFTTGALASAATLQYSGVQLEAGTIATPYEFTQYSAQLEQCQRYYEVFVNTGQPSGTWACYNTNQSGGLMYWFKVQKRATPTVTIQGLGWYYQFGPGPGVGSCDVLWNAPTTTSVSIGGSNSNGLIAMTTTQAYPAYGYGTISAEL